MKFSDSMLLADLSCGGKSLGSKAAIASAIRGSANSKTNRHDLNNVAKSSHSSGIIDACEDSHKDGAYIGCRRKCER